MAVNVLTTIKFLTIKFLYDKLMIPNDSTKPHRRCVEIVDAALEYAVPVFFR